MRWSFHKRRNRRYQIALEELKKTYSECLTACPADLFYKKNLSKLSHADRVLLKRLQRMTTCFTPYSRDYKKRHSKFLNELRKCVRSLEHLDGSKSWHGMIHKVILELCKTKFYRIHLFLFGHHLLQDLFASLIHQQETSELNFDRHFQDYSFLDESRLILASQPLLFMERDFRKMSEKLTQTIFDPHKYNHPFLLYTFGLHSLQGGVRRVKMVRMGSPTVESIGKKPTIIAEFQGFLLSLKAENKNHLYVNKQRTWGREGQRSFAVKQLESQFDNFFCICLPSDGAFYYQQMSYAQQSDASLFKKTFYQLLIGEIGSGYYHFPQAWLENQSFCEGLIKIINRVHKAYFNEQSTLNVQERRYFIDHVYTQIIIYCLQLFSIQSINITCRDGIDRAGCEQTKLLYYFQLSLGIENDIESKIERQYLMHIPPYLAKNRPIVKERREYLYELMNHCYDSKGLENIRVMAQETPLLYAKPLFIKRA